MTPDEFRELLKTDREEACRELARTKFEEWENDGVSEEHDELRQVVVLGRLYDTPLDSDVPYPDDLLVEIFEASTGQVGDDEGEVPLPFGGSHAPMCPYRVSGPCDCWRSDPDQNPELEGE